MRACALAVALVGCTSDTTITWHQLDGAPALISRLAFDSHGNPIVFGGPGVVNGSPTDSTVQHLNGGRWVQADAILGARSGEAQFARQPGGSMFALVKQNLYRLDDEVASQWTQVPMPAPPSMFVSTFAIDTAGTYYWSDSVFGIWHWAPGQSTWTQFPGTYAAQTEQVAVGNDGTIFATIHGAANGIASISTTGTELVVDCNQLQYLNCQASIGGFDGLGLDDAGTLNFNMCPQNYDTLQQLRLRAGSTTVETVATLPAKRGDTPYTRCGDAQTMPGGTVFLERILTGDTIIGSADFFRLDGSGWDNVGQLGRPSAGPYTADGWVPIFRDEHTVFVISGPQGDESGLWEGDF